MTAKPKTKPAEPKITSEMQTAENVKALLETLCNGVANDLRFLAPLVRVERTAAELAHLYGAVRDMQDLITTATKALSEASGQLNEFIPQAFDRENLKTFTTKDGYRVTVSQKYFASMKDKEACMQWLKDNGLPDLIQPTVNASTLSAAGKSLLEEGKELPEDIFEGYFKPGVSLTRTKK